MCMAKAHDALKCPGDPGLLEHLSLDGVGEIFSRICEAARELPTTLEHRQGRNLLLDHEDLVLAVDYDPADANLGESIFRQGAWRRGQPPREESVLRPCMVVLEASDGDCRAHKCSARCGDLEPEPFLSGELPSLEAPPKLLFEDGDSGSGRRCSHLHLHTSVAILLHNQQRLRRSLVSGASSANGCGLRDALREQVQGELREAPHVLLTIGMR
mmetsp:Transcript_80630/g.179093  ORF Transcript_80630/g.179093 Transcript_80630/m.179093 type:complete len:214 (+) Transcript_80630:366-1007(+)